MDDRPESHHFMTAARGAILGPLLGAVLLAGAIPDMATSADMPMDLYEVTVERAPGGGQDLEKTFADALTRVLVRVTGQVAIELTDPSLAAFSNPSSFVQQYGAGADGSMVVRFDAEAVRSAVDSSGLPLWSNDRPQTLVWILSQSGDGRLEFLTSGLGEHIAIPGAGSERETFFSPPGIGAGDPDPRDAALSSAELRSLLAGQADLRGVRLMLPVGDIEDMTATRYLDMRGSQEQVLAVASQRYAADAILIGRVRGKVSRQAPVQWTMLAGRIRAAWRGDVEAGPSGLADRLAARMATFASERRLVSIDIADVTSLSDHVTVERYLKSLSIVEQCSATRFRDNLVSYELTVRGGAERLESLLRDSQVVRATVSAEISTASLHYRFLPES
jgi:hypothetical protein